MSQCPSPSSCRYIRSDVSKLLFRRIPVLLVSLRHATNAMDKSKIGRSDERFEWIAINGEVKILVRELDSIYPTNTITRARPTEASKFASG